MNNDEKPIANPHVVLREEFDDWAVLFDPDTGRGFGLNPTGIYAWKLLNGERTMDGICETLRRNVLEVPEDAGEHLVAFVEELTRNGLAGCNPDEVRDDRGRILPCPTGVVENFSDGEREAGRFKKDTKLRYERPRLETFALERRAHGTCNSNGSGDTTTCSPTGNSAGGLGGTGCITGYSASEPYNSGIGCGSGSSAKVAFVACNTGSSASGGNVSCGHGDSPSGGTSHSCNTGSSGS